MVTVHPVVSAHRVPIIALDKVVVKCKAPGCDGGAHRRRANPLLRKHKDFMSMLCDKALDTGYTAVYHEGSGLGTGGVLTHS